MGSARSHQKWTFFGPNLGIQLSVKCSKAQSQAGSPCFLGIWMPWQQKLYTKQLPQLHLSLGLGEGWL